MCARPDNRPFAIQLEVEFLDRLSEPVRDGKVKSVSELIRAALERFDFENVVVVRPAQLMISVRLPMAVRQQLKRVSRAKHTSVGQLVRSAVEAYLPQLEGAAAGQMEMPIPHVELPESTAPAAPKERTKRRARSRRKPKTRASRPKGPRRKRRQQARAKS